MNGSGYGVLMCAPTHPSTHPPVPTNQPTNQPTYNTPRQHPQKQDKEEKARREAEVAARETAALEAAAAGGGGGNDGSITLKLQWVGADGKKMQVVKMRPTDTFEVRLGVSAGGIGWLTIGGLTAQQYKYEPHRHSTLTLIHFPPTAKRIHRNSTPSSAPSSTPPP